MFTEPSIQYQQALAPFQPMAMKVVHCPIDTSLNFTQAKKLLKELKPGCLLIPHRYTLPPACAPSKQDLVIDSDIQTFAFQKHDILKVPLVRRLENINICSKLAASLVPVELRPGLAVATVSGRSFFFSF